jgi:acetyl-CoA carboxylase biotin carboxyl carrier protein
MSRIPFDTAEIRALAQILADTGLTEIEIAEGETRIRVARAHPPATTYTAMAPPAPVAAAAAAPPAAAPDTLDADHPGAVTSPMVGVVYLSPEPGQPTFVTQGQAVAAGQTLLLIEAMKTFNMIKAPHSGTVTRILVNTGAPVEFGEVLMVIE